MTDTVVLLAALQHGDSFFPGGATAFSWGLETLSAEGEVTSAGDVERFVEGQLAHRWAPADWPALVAARAAAGDLQQVAEVDRLVEALTLSRELREGSRRSGLALLAAHGRLGSAEATAYRRLVRAGKCPGHLAVMQGLLWGALGFSEREAGAVSAHLFCIGLLGAALRLGLIGHLDAQTAITRLRPLLAGLLESPAVPLQRMGVFAPAAEIAAMRHETMTARLFAN